MTGKPARLLDIKDVLQRMTASRAHWYNGIKEGIYPKPIHISKQRVAWLEGDIDALIDRLVAQSTNGPWAPALIYGECIKPLDGRYTTPRAAFDAALTALQQAPSATGATALRAAE